MTNRVLVIRFSSLGDVVLASPVFPALKRRLPGAHVTFLTRREYSDIHRWHPDVDAVWSFEDGTQALRKLAADVRDARFDAIVDLHGSLRSRVVCAGAGAPVRRYRKQSWRRAWLVIRPPLKIRRPLRPVVDRYLEAAGASSASAGERVPKVYLPAQARSAGLAWRARLTGGRAGRVVVLLPHARHPPKEWPLHHFLALARMLVQRGDIPVIIPAAEEGDEGDAAVWRAAEREGITRSACLPEPVELAGALAAVDAIVANDSGPMHLGAAVGTPVLGLFGPTSPDLGFRPAGDAADLHLGLKCSPCSRHGRRRCWRTRRFCLEELDPQRVLNALEELLAGGDIAESP